MKSEVDKLLALNLKPCLGIEELVNGCDEEYIGTTALQVASSYGYLPLIIQLLDVNDFGNDGFKRTALHYVALGKNDQTNVTKLLITKGATIDAKDKDENTPLHFAARSGNTGIVELLIENGADTNAQNKYGYTPLFNTINSIQFNTIIPSNDSHTDIANLLIKNGANIGGFHLRLLVFSFVHHFHP